MTDKKEVSNIIDLGNGDNIFMEAVDMMMSKLVMEMII